MEDYERANAREWDRDLNQEQPSEGDETGWQVVTSAKRSKKPQHAANATQSQGSAPLIPQRPPIERRRRPDTSSQTTLGIRQWKTRPGPKKSKEKANLAPSFTVEIDDEAQNAWRHHHPPVATISIPVALVFRQSQHETIARSCGAFIFSEHVGGGRNSRMTFGLWGPPQAITAATEQLRSWVAESLPKAHGESAFAKLLSATPAKREEAEKKWRQEVRKQKFRQMPTPDMFFGAIGSFHWPTAEAQPDEIFGMSYEALDPIRKACSCYIGFIKETSVFQVCGKQENVTKGLLRLRKVYFQIAAKRTAALIQSLVQYTTESQITSHVYLETYALPAASGGSHHAGGNTRQSPRGEGELDSDQSDQLTSSTEAIYRAEHAILRRLKQLHYYRASIRMRARLGTYLVTQYQTPEGGYYTLDEYQDMIKETEFEGSVTHELGHKSTEETLLSVLQQSNHLLTPQDGTEESLKDIKPTYSATFIFQDDAGDLRLMISWREGEDLSAISNPAQFVIKSKKWSRLERTHDSSASSFDITSATPLIDVSIQDLQTGLAWHIDAQAAHAVDESRIPPHLSTFAEKLTISPHRLSNKTDIAFLAHAYIPTNLVSMQQRISYEYTLTGSDYTLELARFQDRFYNNSSNSSAAGNIVREPRWGIQLYRTEWDTMFAENERLKIGAATEWRDDAETWFPRDLPLGSPAPEGAVEEEKRGWEQLMEKMVRVRELVARTMAEAEAEEV